MAAPAPENATIAAAAMASLILFIGSSPKLTPARACSITACPAVRFRFAGGFCSADKRHGRPVHYGKNRPRHGDVILTFVPTSVTCRVPAHSRTPFAKVFGNAERVRWPRAGGYGPFPGRLGHHACRYYGRRVRCSLDWDRRRRATPVQTASQEAWPALRQRGR